MSAGVGFSTSGPVTTLAWSIQLHTRYATRFVRASFHLYIYNHDQLVLVKAWMLNTSLRIVRLQACTQDLKVADVKHTSLARSQNPQHLSP